MVKKNWFQNKTKNKRKKEKKKKQLPASATQKTLSDHFHAIRKKETPRNPWKDLMKLNVNQTQNGSEKKVAKKH